MRKTKTYTRTRFDAEVLREAANALIRIYGSDNEPANYLRLAVEHPDSEWQYDSLEEFLADYRVHRSDAMLHLSVAKGSLMLWVRSSHTRVSVAATARPNVESVFRAPDCLRQPVNSSG